jgi:hypothetical protein
MGSLKMIDKTTLEKYLGMSSGYVLGFTDRTFAELIADAVDADIHSDVYTAFGTSKANKLRAFWHNEPDDRIAAVLEAILDHHDAITHDQSAQDIAQATKCRAIVARLRTSSPRLSSLKAKAKLMNAKHLAEQIGRMEAAVSADPRLAIGTAKELIETCCKTILAERGETVDDSADVPTLTKMTFKTLQLVPAEVPDNARGADIIKRLLSNLATVGHGLAELRNLYGTGHGKHGKTGGLLPRHAKLAVGAAATLSTFLFETHTDLNKRAD